MELPQEIRECLNDAFSIEPELIELKSATTDKQLLMIAHKIKAKMQVKKDVGFNIEKSINESRK